MYEKTKHALTEGRLGHSQTLAYGLAGITATVFHDAVMNPAEGPPSPPPRKGHMTIWWPWQW